MSMLGRSFLTIEDLGSGDLQKIFSRTQLFKREFPQQKSLSHLFAVQEVRHEVMGMVFFEPSTRTRMSFEIAAKRLGVQTVLLDSQTSSSIIKGESYVQTLETLSAMSPDLLIVRHTGTPEVEEFLKKSSIPVINAGDGVKSHPTQALLDVFTIKEALKSVKGKNVLIVGDIKHSRVAASNLKLLKQLEANVAFCAPEVFIPKENSSIKVIEDFGEALNWCDACMCLRVQKERHSNTDLGFSWDDYKSKYFLDANKLNHLNKNSIILHPGPVVGDYDISPEVLKDPRCLVNLQVTNGVFVRTALLSLMIGISV